MRNTLVIGVMGTLLFAGGLVRAGNITFTSSGSISGTDNYNGVFVHNDGTVLQILGGTISYLYAYEGSRVEMSGGTISNGANFLNTSSFLMTGGVINSYLVGTGAVDIDGGIINNAEYIKGWSVLNLRGGTINLFQGIFDEGLVNIYGYNFVRDPIHYQISGNLSDGNPFAFKMNSATYGKTNLIVTPEPVSFFLLGIGGLFLRRTCKK
jgi:hypothetical protein